MSAIDLDVIAPEAVTGVRVMPVLHERVDLAPIICRTLEALQTRYGREVVPVHVPIGSEHDFKGVVDLISGKAREDYPTGELDFLRERGADLSGIEKRPGESFFWAGRYHFDLNTRDTLETRLGVFADFEPKIPESFRGARYVFLGNIDPALQHDVLDQVEAPDVVACDTMNYWISGSRDALLELLGRVRILLVNDEEVRQLAWPEADGPVLGALEGVLAGGE